MDTSVTGSAPAAAATETFDTVIVGGGQAGLAAGYHLSRRGRPFVILEAHDRVGDSWRCHWDSLRLYSPAHLDGLPGMAFPAARHSFPTKDDVADFLEAYAQRFELPVRTGTCARRLSHDGRTFVVDVGSGHIEAGNVIVATGTFGRKPSVPALATDLVPAITQLHSSEYRGPQQLPPGRVLVVGAAHSGADIAYEVAQARSTVLCGRDTGQVPPRLESPVMWVLFPVLWFVWGHVMSVRWPRARRLRAYVRSHGGPFLRVKRSDLAAAGVERITERVVGARDGLPVLADGRVLEVATVIWCTGFRQDFSWIELPVIGEDGWPVEFRGVVPGVRGL